MKIYSIVLAFMAIAFVSSCKKEVETGSVQCYNGFVRENNECDCPLPPLAHVMDNGNICYRLDNDEYASTIDIPCFWPKLLIVRFPSIQGLEPGRPVGISINGDDKISNRYRSTMGAYYHYPKGEVDSFSVLFLGNEGKCDSTDERFVLTGIIVSGKPERTVVRTLDHNGKVTSGWPVSFR